MFKMYLNEDGSVKLPQQVCDWMGVEPGDPITVKIVDGKLVLHEWESGAGILSNYAKKKGLKHEPETSEQRRARIADYLEKLNAPKPSHSRVS